MKNLVCILLLMPLAISAQQQNIWYVDSGSSGIQFEQGLSWSQLLIKAKKEHKYIFLDCFATWCAPCRLMEHDVFSKKNVGYFMNPKFISIRVQMDTSKKDNEYVKSWYADAHKILEVYKVAGFPTYLFFSPDGEIVHRYLYALPDSLFLKVAKNALDPEKQYYSLLENYKSGKKNYPRLNYLADIAKRIGEDTLANSIALDYLHNYLNHLKDKELTQKKYFDFISTFLPILNSKDRLFNFIYKNGPEVDKIAAQNDFSKNIVHDIIIKEEIIPRMWPDNKAIATAPDWDQLTLEVRKKYNKYYTDLVILHTQLKWYTQKKDRQNQIKYTVKNFEKYGLDTAGVGWAIINNTAYDLFFKYCESKDTLNKMIRWMEIINKNHQDDQANMDTYANLLYKVGRIKDAIAWEEKAAKLEEESALNEKRGENMEFKETLMKMKKGTPTWVNK